MYTALVDVMAFKSAGRMKIEIPISQMKEDDLEEDLRDPDIRLTSFVRSNYLEHLTKRLFENVQSCASEEWSSSCKADVERCAIQMEHKALRQCMVVRLYQRAITSMVGDIKHSTEHSQLHSNLQAFVPSSSEKSTQTEAATLTPFQMYDSSRLTPSDSVVPRGKGSAALLDSRGLKVSHLADIMEYDSSRDYCERSENKILPLCPRSLPLEQAVKVNEQLTGVTITETCAKKSVTGPQLHKSVDTCSQRTLVEASIVDFQQQPHRNPQFDSVCEKKPKKIEVKKRVLCEPKCSPSRTDIDPNFESSMLTLDQRVAAIHGEYYNLDGSTDDKSKRKTKKKIVWQYEKLHRYKILNARLTALGKLRRLKVEHQFLVLFGKDVPHGCEETAAVDDPLASYKERIAPWVVKYLMPHYSSGTIKSRPLFKYTAKYITDNLIDTNHLPDEEDVRNSVDLLFTS